MAPDDATARTISRTRDFAGATFDEVDLSGVLIRGSTVEGMTIRDSYAVNMRIVASAVDHLRINRHEASGSVLVDDVDVTDYVSDELDRRYPERAVVRRLRNAPSLGVPHTDYPAQHLAEHGVVVHPDARPEWTAVVDAFSSRVTQVGDALRRSDDTQLAEVRLGSPLPVYDPETKTFAECLCVIFTEFVEHRRFAERDLGPLERLALGPHAS